MAKHAVLSASSSERWLNCPPSARLCEGYEDKGSDYAAEGTDAHTLCEYRLKQALGIPAEDPIENLSWYNEEMEEFNIIVNLIIGIAFVGMVINYINSSICTSIFNP